MESLHPTVRVVWILQAALAAVVVAVVGYGATLVPFVPVGVAIAGAIAVAVAALGVAHALLRYRAWGFVVDDDALYLDRGVLTKVETSVPFVRVQHVDTRRGPLARLVGLASVVVYTAGSRGADVTIPGLAPGRARELRERLRDLAIASEGEDAV